MPEIKPYLDSIGVEVSIKPTKKCPLGCDSMTPASLDLLSTYPRGSHTHGRVYQLQFSSPNYKMVTTEYVTNYDQEQYSGFARVILGIGVAPDDLANNLDYSRISEYQNFQSFRKVWYLSASVRQNFINFVSSYRYNTLDDMMYYDVLNWEKVLKGIYFHNPGKFDHFTNYVDWQPHKYLIFAYDRARKEYKKFEKFFSYEERDTIDNLQHRNR